MNWALSWDDEVGSLQKVKHFHVWFPRNTVLFSRGYRLKIYCWNSLPIVLAHRFTCQNQLWQNIPGAPCSPTCGPLFLLMWRHMFHCTSLSWFHGTTEILWYFHVKTEWIIRKSCATKTVCGVVLALLCKAQPPSACPREPSPRTHSKNSSDAGGETSCECRDGSSKEGPVFRRTRQPLKTSGVFLDTLEFWTCPF